jgi:hypothetical protein
MRRTRIVNGEHDLRRGDDDGKMSLRAFLLLVNRAIAWRPCRHWCVPLPSEAADQNARRNFRFGAECGLFL